MLLEPLAFPPDLPPVMLEIGCLDLIGMKKVECKGWWMKLLLVLDEFVEK